MEPNTNPGASLETNNTEATPTKKSKGLLIATVIFAILAIAGIGAGAYFFMDSNNKSTENANLRTKINLLQAETGTELVEKQENDTTVTIVIPSSKESSTTTTEAEGPVTEAEELLRDKYGFRTSVKPLYDGWYHYIDNFDQASKILFTIYKAEFGSGQQGIGTISYDNFNSSYVYFFSNTEPLEKKTYELNSKAAIDKIVYQPETDSFSVEWPDGLGGDTPRRWHYQVINTANTTNGFKATVASVITEPEDTIVSGSMAAYEFNFIEEDGEYKLISIEKL